jgi:hypothetical protein
MEVERWMWSLGATLEVDECLGGEWGVLIGRWFFIRSILIFLKNSFYS